jgi:hypothetical protein
LGQLSQHLVNECDYNPERVVEKVMSKSGPISQYIIVSQSLRQTLRTKSQKNLKLNFIRNSKLKNMASKPRHSSE